MAFFGIGNLENIPLTKEMGFGGSGGVGGRILGTFSHIFGAIF